MYRNTLCAMVLAVAWSAPLSVRAQDAELAKIREEIRQMKEAYERRIEALEKRLQETEAKAGKAEDAANQAATQASSRPVGENALNPAISLIMQGTVARSSRDPARYQITGFAPSGGEVAPPGRGLRLAESELVVTANIDPYFRGQLIAALTPENQVEVEEAFIQTLALGRGFTLKGGRFLSGIGYQNEIHQHFWDFQDAPLAYKAFLGGRLNDDGVQLKWVAPTELFVELGTELGRGRVFPGTVRNKNGAGAWSLFGHLGGDLGASTAWRAGLSYLRTSPRDRTYDDVDSTGTGVSNSFSGTSRLWVLDGILKWAPNRNPTDQNFKLQGEYFRRTEDGSMTYDTLAQSLGTQTDRYASRQSGWYAQGLYQFIPQWRVGYRHDRLNAGTASIGLVNAGARSAADFPILAGYSPKRNMLMVDWSPTEFSRIRVQFARDYSRMGEPDNQVFVQYIMSLGAHGAHKF